MSRGPRRVLVTGASGGLGEGLSRRLAARGDLVVLAARRLDRLEAIAEEIRGAGGEARTLRLDVADAEATAAAVRGLDDELEGLDLVIANAGMGETRAAHATPWSLTRDTLATNALGAVATLAPLIPRMAARRCGHLVGISSLATFLPSPGSAAYTSSKAALAAWLEALRPELAVFGVRVTAVHPGFIRTAMIDGARHPLPFAMEIDPAVARILRGIDRGRAVVAFPRRLAWPLRLLAALPRALRDPLCRRLVVAPLHREVAPPTEGPSTGR